MQPYLTFANWSVVAPGSKDLSHPLAANGLTALKNIIFSTTELHHTVDAAHKHTIPHSWGAFAVLLKHHKCDHMSENKSVLLRAVWLLPKVVAVAFSILWLSGVRAGVRRLSYSTFIYYTQTKPPQSIQPLCLDFSVLRKFILLLLDKCNLMHKRSLPLLGLTNMHSQVELLSTNPAGGCIVHVCVC